MNCQVPKEVYETQYRGAGDFDAIAFLEQIKEKATNCTRSPHGVLKMPRDEEGSELKWMYLTFTEPNPSCKRKFPNAGVDLRFARPRTEGQENLNQEKKNVQSVRPRSNEVKTRHVVNTRILGKAEENEKVGPHIPKSNVVETKESIKERDNKLNDVSQHILPEEESLPKESVKTYLLCQKVSDNIQLVNLFICFL